MIDSLSFRKGDIVFPFGTLKFTGSFGLSVHNFHIFYTGKGHGVFL